jgi:RecB family exonuclease
VLLYGFDDLSREQIELIDALARAAPVTVAIAWEERSALAARAGLLGVLRDELGGTVVAELEPDASHTGSGTLFHLERNLFEAGAGTAAADGTLRMLVSAGARGEAELIGRRIAALIAAGTDPDRIAIAVRSPDRQAPLLARVLGSLGVPAAAEARVPLARTATGTTLLRLLAIASGEATVADLLAFLRGPARASAETVDWFERDLARGRITDVDSAIDRWSERNEREIWGLSALRDPHASAAELAELVAELASDIAEYPHLRAGPVPAGDEAIELRAAAEVRRATAEVAELGDAAPGGAELAELLRLVRVPLWRGSTEGRVRILSPYRLRATRVEDLFVAGLTDGGFPAPGGGDPLLGDERRRELGIEARRDPAEEERYLFYACVSRPERSLWLSWPATDESGKAIARSPFVDELRALLEPPPDPELGEDELEREISDVAGLADVVVAPEQASSPRDLRRALAALPEASARDRLAALEVDPAIASAALAAVEGARARAERSRKPGPLRNPAVLERLGERMLFSASTLEQYDACSYIWFANTELRPAPIEPDPEPLETGGIVHAALEALYRRPPGGPRPTPTDVGAWIEAAHRHLREAAADRDWDLEGSSARISLSRLDAVLARYLRRDAATGGPMMPRPDLLEAGFGTGAEGDSEPAAIGSFQLRGRIDRVDVSSDGKALVRDYKLSTKVTAAKHLINEGKLQLPLYMEAVRGMGLEPIGGVYHPLNAATNERADRPRGMLAAEHKGALIPATTEDYVGTDFLDDDEFEAKVTEAVAKAEEIVAGIRAGRIGRNPRDGECPAWCRLAPICRMERGIVDPDEEEEEEGAA